MEKKVGIWLDSEKAYIISLINGMEKLERIESNVESRVRYEGEKKSSSRIYMIIIAQNHPPLQKTLTL